MQSPWSQPLNRPQSPYLEHGAWTQAPWEAGCRPPPTPAQAERLLSSLCSWALYTPLWLPWCPASEPSLATSMSPKSPGHAASRSTGQTTVSIGQLCVAWICQAASRQSDLGHVLPGAGAGPALLPSPTQTSLPPQARMAQLSGDRTERARGLDFNGAASLWPGYLHALYCRLGNCEP